MAIRNAFNYKRGANVMLILRNSRNAPYSGYKDSMANAKNYGL